VETPTDQDLAMVAVEFEQDEPRDLSRAARTLVAIQLRLLEKSQRKESDEPDPGLRPSIN
jgi:hypothetical protein